MSENMGRKMDSKEGAVKIIISVLVLLALTFNICAFAKGSGGHHTHGGGKNKVWTLYDNPKNTFK